MIEVAIKGARALERGIADADRKTWTPVKIKRALSVAMKVEGYKLRRNLQKEIRAGAPGGKSFSPLSIIAQYRTGRKRRAKPLSRLAIAVRYMVTSKDPFEMHIGWVGPKISKSWKRLAAMHQEGFTREVGAKEERWLRRRLHKDSKTPKKYRKFFALRKGTTQFKTPARPIIDPFWHAHQTEAWQNIRRNFRRKMRGERI